MTFVALTTILGIITIWCGLASFNRDRDDAIVRNHHTTGIWLMTVVQYSYVVLSDDKWSAEYLTQVVSGSLGLFIAVAWVRTCSLFPPRKRKAHSPQPETPPQDMPEREWFQQ